MCKKTEKKHEHIATVYDKEVYVTESFKKSLEELGLTEEEKKKLLSVIVDKIAERMRDRNEHGRSVV